MCNTAYVPGEPPCDEDHGEPISSREEMASQSQPPSSRTNFLVINVDVAKWLKSYEGRTSTAWALRMWRKAGADVCRKIIEICESDGYILAGERSLAIVNDLGALARMLTIEGRRCGLDMDCEISECGVFISLRDGIALPTYCFRTMTSAQCLLAVWLALPNGAAAAAEIALLVEQPKGDG